MGALVWVMVGLAIWHFSIFIPDRFLGGIVGAFVGSVIGSLVFGYLIGGASFPGNDDMTLATAVEAIPGTIIGMGVVFALGVRAENRAAARADGIRPSR